ncbi:MAG TPA: response regulator transcription factor [Solirubrobacteraceae bacterium]|jgi:two-component system response regulator DesR|nr:response regulator transcription factor [Solirubrobacteraceae bacterium]
MIVGEGSPAAARAHARRRSATTVMVVDDHAAVRRGTELLLREAGFAVLPGAGEVELARAAVRDAAPAVVVLDLRLGARSGLHLGEMLGREHAGLGILLYTGAADAGTLRRALEAPVGGVLLKAAPPEHLVAAVERVAAGGRYVDPGLTAVAPPTPRGRLTAREREILQLIASGRSGEAVAEELFLSGETVRTHVRNAVAKLGASSRAHAVAIALQRGEIDFDA